MKHKSPQGPSAHRGGHIWAVPSPVGSAIWGDLGSGSPWGAGPGLGSPPRGALVTPSSLLLLSYCCKYFNEMEKEKKKTKKKKISSLEATGSLRPGPAPALRSGARRPASAARTSVCTCASRPGGRASRAAFYNPETDATIPKQQRNKEPVSFPPARSVSSPPAPPARPWHPSVSPPGACTSLPAPGPEACLPLPSPLAQGRHPHAQRCFPPRWLRYPFCVPASCTLLLGGGGGAGGGPRVRGRWAWLGERGAAAPTCPQPFIREARRQHARAPSLQSTSRPSPPTLG